MVNGRFILDWWRLVDDCGRVSCIWIMVCLVCFVMGLVVVFVLWISCYERMEFVLGVFCFVGVDNLIFD